MFPFQKSDVWGIATVAAGCLGALVSIAFWLIILAAAIKFLFA